MTQQISLATPCETYLSCHDPAMSEEEVKQVFDKMQEELRLRTKTGTEAWLKQKQQKV